MAAVSRVQLLNLFSPRRQLFQLVRHFDFLFLLSGSFESSPSVPFVLCLFVLFYLLNLFYFVLLSICSPKFDTILPFTLLCCFWVFFTSCFCCKIFMLFIFCVYLYVNMGNTNLHSLPFYTFRLDIVEFNFSYCRYFSSNLK